MGGDSQQQRLKTLLDRALRGVDPSDHKGVAGGLSAFYAAAVEEAQSQFDAQHLGSPCSRFICSAADMAVMTVRDSVAGAGTTGWAAVGGYGRGLMSPGSRVNLLILHREERDEQAEASARAALSMLSAAVPNSEATWGAPAGVLQKACADFIAASDLLETRLIAGSESLYEEFKRSLNERFLVPRWGRFCADLIEESLSRRDPYTSSPYCTEPNLKEGTGCLRDIGMMQKVAAALGSVPALHRHLAEPDERGNTILTPEEGRSLEDAFEFILGARNALHFLVAGRSDVLEMGLQADVARALGYAAAGEGEAAVKEFMRDLFRRTGRVSRMLRTFSERFDHLRSVAWDRPRLRTRRATGDGFAVVGGKIYSALHTPFRKEEGAHRMMTAFLLSQRQHIPISQQLLDQIAEHLDVIEEEDLRDRTTAETFLELLAGSVGVADRLRWMRECGLLQRYIPEFERLLHVVHYEQSFDYTLDEHAIEAIAVIDELAHTDQEDEVAQRELLSQVERPDLLRLALLLHHLMEHEENEGELATRVGQRMHLSGSEVDTLRFLLRHRDTLTYYAERRDFHEPPVLERAVAEVESPQRLRLLYLFTYADWRAIGRAGWFAWRDALLYELYQHLMAGLAPEFEPRATIEYFDDELLRQAEERGLAEQAARLSAIVPERYKIEVAPSEALEHLELIGKIQRQPAAISYRTEGRQAHMWFCTSDLPARFSQIAGSLTYNGLSIISARAYTLADGTILDSFLVHKQDLPISSEPRFWQKVESDLIASVSGELDLKAAIDQMVESRRAAPSARGLPSRREVASVHFDNESSAQFTILDVVCWDRAGLLYSLCRALSETDVNIEFAKISTRLDLAQDVFYVNDSRTAKKITAKKHLARIRAALIAAVEA